MLVPISSYPAKTKKPAGWLLGGNVIGSWNILVGRIYNSCQSHPEDFSASVHGKSLLIVQLQGADIKAQA